MPLVAGYGRQYSGDWCALPVHSFFDLQSVECVTKTTVLRYSYTIPFEVEWIHRYLDAKNQQ